MIIKFFLWFFSAPSTIIAIVSVIIAFSTYIYQRREKQKNRACLIVEKYSREIIPRIRYINKVLELTNVQGYLKKFDGFNKFDLSELS